MRIKKMKTILDGALRKAMALTHGRNPAAATKVLQDALSGRNREKDGAPRSADAPKVKEASTPLDAVLWKALTPLRREAVLKTPHDATHEFSPVGEMMQMLQKGVAQGFGFDPIPDADHGARAYPSPAADGARFLSRSFSCDAGSRGYKLFVPRALAAGAARALPLIIMLHGCKQDPDDFALGTGMNLLAEERGFLVAYPEQSPRSNQMGCWNWFNLKDQERDSGEPAIIAGIAREIMSEFDVDPDRVFVAGLSAGGAMAAILSATYPDLFKGAGIHSGLPCGAATDLASAFNSMRNGAVMTDTQAPETNVRTIVFQGGADRTVHPSNADLIVAFARAGLDGAVEMKQRGRSEGGVAYQRTIIADRGGKPQVEYWAIDDMGHAWSGGSLKGSFTDPNGPDASREMLRFFLQH